MIYAFKNFYKALSDSFLYPVVLMVLTYISWVLPNFDIVYFIILVLIGITPFVSKKSVDFIPMIIFPLFSVRNYHFKVFNSISLMIILDYCYVFTIILIYIFRLRNKITFGQLFIPLIILFIIVLTSNVINILSNNEFNSNSLITSILLLSCIIGYVFLSTLFKEDDSFTFICKVSGYVGLLMFMEIGTYYLMNMNMFQNFDYKNIDLLFNSSKEILSVVLTMLMPLVGVMIYQKKWMYSFFLLFILFSLFMLFTSISIISGLAFSIVVILVSFRSYKKAAPYVYLFTLAIFIVLLVVLLSVDRMFLNKFIEAFKHTNFIDSENSLMIKDGLNLFINAPVIGVSYQGIINKFGSLISFNNEVITCLVVSGSIGILCYLAHIVNTFFVCFFNKTETRYHYLVLIITMFICGIFTDGIFDPSVLFIFLIINSTFQNSGKLKNNIIVNSDFFAYKNNLNSSLN